jgi:hypothetical protein
VNLLELPYFFVIGTYHLCPEDTCIRQQVNADAIITLKEGVIEELIGARPRRMDLSVHVQPPGPSSMDDVTKPSPVAAPASEDIRLLGLPRTEDITLEEIQSLNPSKLRKACQHYDITTEGKDTKTLRRELTEKVRSRQSFTRSKTFGLQPKRKQWHNSL